MRDIKEFDGLYARLEDLKKRAVRGEMGISAFLSPRELHYAESYLRRTGSCFVSLGGYNGAERKRVYILPEYMEGVESADELSEYGSETDIVAIEIKGSGFVSLSHRDFMGALLCLGVERGVIGDIITLDGGSAVAFCDKKIADFIVAELRDVGRDKVRCRLMNVDKDFCPKRSFAAISDTVASARLDCVVAALCKLSREKARECVLSGLAELDYEYCERPDREVTAPCVLSVRGYGKFRVCSLGELTKKGRMRLVAEKFL
jgi:RNA-binding protein YlmH